MQGQMRRTVFRERALIADKMTGFLRIRKGHVRTLDFNAFLSQIF